MGNSRHHRHERGSGSPGAQLIELLTRTSAARAPLRSECLSCSQVDDDETASSLEMKIAGREATLQHLTGCRPDHPTKRAREVCRVGEPCRMSCVRN